MVSPSFSSGLLSDEGPTKYRVRWVNLHSGQVGMPRYLPWGREWDASWTESLVADSGCAGSLGPCAVLRGKASAMSLGAL